MNKCKITNDKTYKLFKNYDELTEVQKKAARELRPKDYKEWQYATSGVKIELAAR